MCMPRTNWKSLEIRELSGLLNKYIKILEWWPSLRVPFVERITKVNSYTLTHIHYFEISQYVWTYRIPKTTHKPYLSAGSHYQRPTY